MDKTNKPREQKKPANLWTTRLKKQSQISATNHGCRQVILYAFYEVHYVTLRDEDTFYKFVSPLALLAHVVDGVGGLEVTNVDALLAELPN